MKQEKKKHRIQSVLPGSIAEELEIEAGDMLLAVNDTEIEDIFDYQFLIQDSYIEVLVEKPDGEQWLLEVEKEFEEDLGILFENGLMDEYRHCRNKCIFCFIDQMPPGMRDTLYFKDDDSRLSFLQGNYVTLTNMSEHDIGRICRYRLSPINISFHTMNPKLRCQMLNNRFAGEALKKVDTLYAAGIHMNGQIVLCKGVNDGAELKYSISRLTEYIPNLESVSVVPVGLTRYREGLYPLEPFTKEDAVGVIGMIEGFQRECFEKYGTHFVHASDEWYILAGMEMPEAERYDGYLQLENGVGMLRLLEDEFEEAMAGKSLAMAGMSLGMAEKSSAMTKDMFAMTEKNHVMAESTHAMAEKNHVMAESTYAMAESSCAAAEICAEEKRACMDDGSDSSGGDELAIATGKLAYPYIRKMADRMMEAYPWLNIHVYPITNEFFGELITVSGLITGQDLQKQLQGKPLGSRLLLPENILRSGEDLFLDDMRAGELEKALQVPINIVKSSGKDFVEAVLGRGDQ